MSPATAILIGLGVFYVVAVVFLVRAIRRAPLGRQDAAGFHQEDETP